MPKCRASSHTKKGTLEFFFMRSSLLAIASSIQSEQAVWPARTDLQRNRSHREQRFALLGFLISQIPHRHLYSDAMFAVEMKNSFGLKLCFFPSLKCISHDSIPSLALAGDPDALRINEDQCSFAFDEVAPAPEESNSFL